MERDVLKSKVPQDLSNNEKIVLSAAFNEFIGLTLHNCVNGGGTTLNTGSVVVEIWVQDWEVNVWVIRVV